VCYDGLSPREKLCHSRLIIVLLHWISYTVSSLFGLVQIWQQIPSDDPYSVKSASHVTLLPSW
jgi:hypothetical protein